MRISYGQDIPNHGLLKLHSQVLCILLENIEGHMAYLNYCHVPV